MKYGILGTGDVAHVIAAKLMELGHEVMMGARDAANEKSCKLGGDGRCTCPLRFVCRCCRFRRTVIQLRAGHPFDGRQRRKWRLC